MREIPDLRWLGVRGRICRRGLRQDTDLLEQLHHGDFRPMLADLAVLEAVDVNFRPGDALVGGLFAHHRALMRRGGRTPFDYPVSGSNKILFLYDYVREGAIHHNPDLA